MCCGGKVENPSKWKYSSKEPESVLKSYIPPVQFCLIIADQLSLITPSLSRAAAVCRRGCLSSLRVLDLSYNGLVGDDGWSALFAAGGLGSLEDVDLSLRPSTSAPCSAWLSALLCALPRLPALTRLAVQRWTMSSEERQQLSHCLRKRSVLLEWDPPNKDATSSFKATNQESPEESRPEE